MLLNPVYDGAVSYHDLRLLVEPLALDQIPDDHISLRERTTEKQGND